MNVIGFNFTKMSAEKMSQTKPSNINTNIEFIDVEKDKVEILKDSEAANISFKYSLNYEARTDDKKQNPKKHGEVVFEGRITLSLNKEESKNLTKSWKKKKLPNDIKLPLFNLILRRCTPKTIYLQDEVNLPTHIPMPKIAPRPDQ